MKLSLSNTAIVLVILACLLIDLKAKYWEQRDRVIEDDVHWYYGYLPATFIYDDIALVKSDYSFPNHYFYFWTVNTADGKKVIKTTMGLSVLYAPFFFTANYFAHVFNFPATGFSEIYKIFLLLSSVFYLFVGLDFLKKILLQYKFSDRITSITLLLTGLGTNLLFYSSLIGAMPHVYNFCLFAVFLWYTIKWYEHNSLKNTIILGLLFGLITLIRPSNVVILLIFALYGVTDLLSFKQRLSLFRKETFLLNILFVLAILVWVPQFLYWKKVTGNYILYSYTNEHFFFNHPHILAGLFSFRKGWLVYTPLMGFALLGILFLKGDSKKLQSALLAFLVVNLYVIFSWWCWWYGGTFGQRSLIDSYALLAVPFASFINYISKTKLLIRFLLGGLSLFFVWLNIFQTFQCKNDSMHWDGMTRQLYFKQFGKLARIPDFDKYVSTPDYEEAAKGNSCEPVIESIKPGNKKGIHIKAFNNNYLCAERSASHIIIANRAEAGNWETFRMTLTGTNTVSFQAYEGHFLCAELKNHGEITFSREHAWNWETFTIVHLENNMLAIKAFNGKYLSVDEKSLQVFANSDSIGKNEKFMLVTE
jgi:hypothetical protein